MKLIWHVAHVNILLTLGCKTPTHTHTHTCARTITVTQLSEVVKYGYFCTKKTSGIYSLHN